MVVCVLKHTPGVYSEYSNNDNETSDMEYMGLEVEVWNKIGSRHRSVIDFASCPILDNSWNCSNSEFFA